jgi:hypothetical protein
MVPTIPDIQSSLLSQYLASILIQLPKGDDVVPEARDEEDTSKLDLLSILGGAHHNVTPAIHCQTARSLALCDRALRKLLLSPS